MVVRKLAFFREGGSTKHVRDVRALLASRKDELDDAALRTLLARGRTGVELLSVDDAFRLPEGNVRYAEGRNSFCADDDHLSQAGAELVKDRIAGAIAKPLTKS